MDVCGGLSLSKEMLDTATIIVTGAGLKECNGRYIVSGNQRGKPRWECKETGAYILWWGGSCGWEMYFNSSFMCRYWTCDTDADTYPWNLKSSKWIVRPGNNDIEPPPTVVGKVCIGSKIEQGFRIKWHPCLGCFLKSICNKLHCCGTT